MSHTFRPLLPSGVPPDVLTLQPESEAQLPVARTRENLRPCDACRRKKVRCDGPQQHDRVCTDCRRLRKPCTYVQMSKRPNAPPKKYVQVLETRLEKVEQLLRQRCPEADLMRELGALTIGEHDALGLTRIQPPDSSDDMSSEEEASDDLNQPLYETKPAPFEKNILGDSNPLILAREAARTRNRLQGNAGDATLNLAAKRPEFWRPPQHELRLNEIAKSEFRPRLPPPGVLQTLINVYFASVNTFGPILHKELLLQQLKREPENEGLLAVVLLVCACGSRVLASEQAGRLSEDIQNTSPPGWEYFEQVEPLLDVPTFAMPSLYDVQTFILAAVYLLSHTGTFTRPWNLIGVAVRLVYQVGAHRQVVYKSSPNLVDELWKRTFWLLVMYDRHLCVTFGQATFLREDTYDVGMPLEIDDEYWDLEQPQASYPLKERQPANKPAAIAYFVNNSQLSVIMGTGAQTMYSINRSKALMGLIGDDWQAKFRTKIDACLDAWHQTIPAHLRWDPETLDPRWLSQSAALHTSYHHARIVLHNPLPFTSKPSSIGTNANHVESLRICTEAANSCVRVFKVQVERGARVIPIQLQAAFTSTMVLLVGMWVALKREGRKSKEEWETALNNVRTCMDAVKKVEKVWAVGGRAWDVLNTQLAAFEESLKSEPLGKTVESQPSAARHSLRTHSIADMPMLGPAQQTFASQLSQYTPAQLPIATGYHDPFAAPTTGNVADSFVGFAPEVQMLFYSFETGADRGGHGFGFGPQQSSSSGWDAGTLDSKLGVSEASGGPVNPAVWFGGGTGGSFVAGAGPSNLMFTAAEAPGHDHHVFHQ